MSVPEAESTPSKDRLGILLGRYSTNLKGLGLLACAAPFLAFGVWLLRQKHIGDGDAYEALPMGVIFGWLATLLGTLMALFCPFYIGHAFEIRKRGVRYYRWGSRRELEWDDIELLQVQKHTVIYTGRGRRSSYRITFNAADETFTLGSMFLGAVNAYSLIEQLKVNARRAFHSDDPLDTKPTGNGGRKKRRRAEEDKKPTGDITIYQEARARIRNGESADAVERSLRDRGIPPAVAAGMIDKIMGQVVRRQAIVENQEPEAKEIQQARQQLIEGTSPDRVERWLNEQGLTTEHASAVVADLRQQIR
jgi:hypothetical protein